jgi:hypothetical protein
LVAFFARHFFAEVFFATGFLTGMSVILRRPYDRRKSGPSPNVPVQEPSGLPRRAAATDEGRKYLLQVSGFAAIQSLFHARNESKFAHLDSCFVA